MSDEPRRDTQATRPPKSAARKAGSKKTTVAQVMTDAVHRLQSTASLNEAAQRMWDHDIGAVPIVDMEGRVTGLVTDRDIAMAAYLQGRLLQDLGVQEVMSTKIQTARPYQPLSEAASIMAQHQVRRLPVVDDEGNLTGMLSLNDLAEASGDAKSGGISKSELAATLRAICAPHKASRAADEEATSP